METSASQRSICVTCHKRKITYFCQGCLETFCFDHLAQHRIELNRELDQIANDHNKLRQNLHERKSDPKKNSFCEQIDRWENDSIKDIKDTAERYRKQWVKSVEKSRLSIETKLDNLAREMNEMQRENEFDEISLNHLKQTLATLQAELNQPIHVPIEAQQTLLVEKMFSLVPTMKGKSV